MSDADAPAFAAAPPEHLDLALGVALVRAGPDVVASAVESINESLEHLRPWMAWAQTPATAESVGTVYGEAAAAWEARTDFTYVLVETATGRVIGGSGLHGRLGPHGLEIGYWLHGDWTGRGVATAAVRALTTAAFAVPGIERVRIQCAVDNVRSARVPARLGFRLVHADQPGTGPCAGVPTQRWEVERADWTG